MNTHLIPIDTSQLLWERWECLAKNCPDREAIVHWDVLNDPFRWTYGSLIEEAHKIAGHLIYRNVTAGDVCATIIRHNKYFYPIYMAIAAIGAIPAIIAYPNARLHPDKFLHGLLGIMRRSGIDWVMSERELDPLIGPLIHNNEGSKIKGILFPLEWVGQECSVRPDCEVHKNIRGVADNNSPFLLQHSSGTTGLQKAVVLSHKAILEHIKRYSEAIRLSEYDKIASWLPLYHDMGLIAAFHMPLAYGISSIHIDPFQWVSSPAIFFQAISREKASLAWIPNFAYNFMADRIRDEEMEGITLSTMRMFINCSEVVRAKSHEKFFNRFQRYGVKKHALAACYAMAETTFAVTQTEPGQEAAMLTVDQDALLRKNVQLPQCGGLVRSLVSSGKPISGCSLKITDENGVELLDDQLGLIAIKSVSLFQEYKNNPEKTQAALKDGWYHSGDFGFFHNGEYFIIGRMDDVIIVAGKNIFPEDIEDAANNVAGVIPGRTVAFGIENPHTGTEDVCIIAETTRTRLDEKDSLRLEIKKAAMDIDVTIATVYLVPPRWLIKSSSGKLSRKANKKRILSAHSAQTLTL